ncbi:MAG: flippase-like domain-containing protein [Nitrospira sp.]|nr:flippase-like domain-containing protein [Nitrospira sp.]MDH4371306.1 flippase-like domain-containing protein [Nitrospira sp.]MDH5498873.1 flippase-like domain-containing protein [Nitrospira sp.]MDH5725855.1 flippase-like domain-containing protein [Nitrospira sp.]
MLRYFLLALGLAVLGLLVWRVGPGHIYEAASQLGPVTLLIILIPSVLMYTIEAYGWKIVLGPAGKAVAFWRLFTIRTAGEVVNMTTPTAYLGGEPLKAYLLKQHNVPMAEGAASVVIAKTTMTIAEVFFILMGIALGFLLLGAGSSAGQTITAALVSVGLLVCSIAGFVFIQHRGLFASILSIVKKLGVRIRTLEAQEEHLRSIDQTILNFYRHHKRAFLASTGVYFFGWLAESLEVFGIIYFLGGSVSFLAAISIGALAVFIKGGSFFIPGSLGAQDAGNLLLLQAFGYSDVTGITFALLRRFRELVWIAIGLLCLAMVGKRGMNQDQRVESPS